MPRPDRLVLVVASVVVLAVHSAAVLAGVPEAVTIGVNLVLALGALAAARRGGFTPAMLGLAGDRRSLAGAAAILAAAGLAVAGLMTASSRPPSAELWFRLLLGVPIGTALCEEVLFRGVLLAALDRLATRRRMASLVASAAFGVWHVPSEVVRLAGPSPAVLGGVLATAAASALVLVPARRWSGGLAVPTAIHAGVNLVVLAAVQAG